LFLFGKKTEVEGKPMIRKERRKLLSETKETIFLKCLFPTPNQRFGGEEVFEEKLLSPRMMVGDRSFFLTFLKVHFWKGNKKRYSIWKQNLPKGKVEGK